MEEPVFLMAVQRILGGVEIEDDLLRRFGVGLQEQTNEQLLNGGRIMADLVIARGLRPAQFQPVERRFAGDRRAVPAPCLQLAGQHRHDRVVPQLVMIIQILVTQRNPEHPLPDQRTNLMLDQLRRARVLEA